MAGRTAVAAATAFAACLSFAAVSAAGPSRWEACAAMRPAAAVRACAQPKKFNVRAWRVQCSGVTCGVYTCSAHTHRMHTACTLHRPAPRGRSALRLSGGRRSAWRPCSPPRWTTPIPCPAAAIAAKLDSGCSVGCPWRAFARANVQEATSTARHWAAGCSCADSCRLWTAESGRTKSRIPRVELRRAWRRAPQITGRGNGACPQVWGGQFQRTR